MSAICVRPAVCFILRHFWLSECQDRLGAVQKGSQLAMLAAVAEGVDSGKVSKASGLKKRKPVRDKDPDNEISTEQKRSRSALASPGQRGSADAKQPGLDRFAAHSGCIGKCHLACCMWLLARYVSDSSLTRITLYLNAQLCISYGTPSLLA